MMRFQSLFLPFLLIWVYTGLVDARTSIPKDRYDSWNERSLARNAQERLIPSVLSQRSSSRRRRLRSADQDSRLAFSSPLSELSSGPLLSSLISIDSPLVLWSLRLLSALGGYVGCVAYIDRPRGELLENVNELFEVRQSSVEGAGLGLFVAATSIPKDTVLGTYPGVLLPLSQNLPKLQQFPACEAYIWRFSDSQYVLDPTDEFGTLQELCTGGSRVSWPLSVELCKILTSPKPTILCRVNEPPLNKDVNVVTDEDLQKRTVTFKLERDVFFAEELFMDYGINYDRSMYGRGAAAANGQPSKDDTTNIE